MEREKRKIDRQIEREREEKERERDSNFGTKETRKKQNDCLERRSEEKKERK